MGSGYETAQVLLATARSHALSGVLRTAYVKVAETLGEYEQNSALAALARAER
jgi:hypothetical protein